MDQQDQGRIQPEVEGGGGTTCRVGAKSTVKSKRADGGTEIFGPLFRKSSLVFQLNNALIHMFPTFRTKREKKSAFGSG